MPCGRKIILKLQHVLGISPDENIFLGGVRVECDELCVFLRLEERENESG
jgi:hypothetical protein